MTAASAPSVTLVERDRDLTLRPLDGWLPAVLPADARSFRVVDPTVRGALRAAGATISSGDADVEIAPADAIDGGAPVAIATVFASASHRLRPVRAVARAGRALVTTADVVRARRALRRRGYTHVEVLHWDFGQTLRPPGVAMGRQRAGLAHYLPQQALAVAWRGPRAPSVLEEALGAANQALGRRLSCRWASVRAGVLLVATDGGLLRLALGTGRTQIEQHRRALDELATLDAPSVAAVTPATLAHGAAGLAGWCLEELLPGSRPGRIEARVLDQCVEFLVDLHRAGASGGHVGLRAQAAIIAPHLGTEDARALDELAGQLEDDLAELPSGFGHGDFFAGNLLVEGGILTGVLDWDAAGSNRLPLLDLLHLLLTESRYGSDERWGSAVLSRLPPLVERDTGVQKYCAAVGIPARGRVRRALTVAYWLDYAAYQLATHPFRATQAGWLDRNVRGVLRAL